ncbi:MAG: hypothetical protein DMD26_05505 [Gemmatimonadetes bacterium]|nr:MAG: hypothetical protein DMD26_05505 [Gemmatimonadota bacterium]
MSGLIRLLAILLLAGAALLGAGAALHPMLTGDAAAQLRTIATTPYWRALHLAMLAGSGFIIAGVWVRLVSDHSMAAVLVAALALVSIGIALNALNIAFMAGSGTHMAALFSSGRAEIESVFEATHPIGLMAARFGNFIVALGAAALGWIEWHDATRPRWLAWLAWLAAGGGFIGVLFFDEASRFALAAVGLLSGWEVATAALALRRTVPSNSTR